ncbi:MAG: hypothetical protein QME81_04330 [bacterium]|nr:hypothetical protein [bacterium]
MKGQRFVFLAIVALLAAFASYSYATETRVGSMGGIDRYTRDNSNVFPFPGTINRYSNQVIAELRGKNNDSRYSIGSHLPFRTDAVCGVYLNYPIPHPITAAVREVAPDLALDRTADLFYGSKMGNSDFGARFSIALDRESTTYGSSESKQSARYLAFAGGLSNEQMDLGCILDLPAAKQEVGTQSEELSSFGLGVNGRYFMAQQGNRQLVPIAHFHYASGSIKDSFEADYSSISFGGGIGVNYQLNENNLVVLGLGVGLSQSTEEVKNGDETTERTITFPRIVMGIESQIKSWLVGRIGASQVYQSDFTEVKPPTGSTTETKEWDKAFDLSFGLGINFGNFSLDALINEGIFFDGPHFISGQSNQMSSMLSATYNLP